MLQDSFAIFASDKCYVDLHVNIWTDMKKSHYIDVGIRVHKLERLEEFSLYIPYRVEAKDIIDLSETLENLTTMKGIFNQTCTISASAVENYYDVQFDYNDSKCKMRVFSTMSSLKNSTFIDSGTILTFSISEWNEENVAYIRFRLPYKSLSEYLSSKRHRYIDALESPLMKEKYLYNFKLNENRTLPKDVLKRLNSFKIVKTVRFFICVPDRCVVGTEHVYKTRIIESDIFKGYIPNRCFLKNSIAYQ